MDKIVFISYSAQDNDKVQILEGELNANGNLIPLVIASNREALKPLAHKVAEGIDKCFVIVPIITKKSMLNQWVNQEIGYAQARGKKIMPIIQKDILDSLKGFIHKQIDLPYTFHSMEPSHENDSFRLAVKMLVSDLIEDFPPIPEIQPAKTEFEKSLEYAAKVEQAFQYKNEKEKFINSPKALELAQTEVLVNIFQEIKQKINILRDKKMYCATQEDPQQFSFMINCEGFNIVFQFQLPFFNSLMDSKLIVNYLSSYAHPKEVKNIKFIFDNSETEQLGWANISDQKFYLSKEIVEAAFAWMVEQVSMRRKSIISG